LDVRLPDLFGPQARGDALPFSDVDFALFAPAIKKSQYSESREILIVEPSVTDGDPALRSASFVGHLIRNVLRDSMRGQEIYEKAMDRYLSSAPEPLKDKKGRYASREEFHDRVGLR
jgi:predicted nucleotidyltransferase